MLLCHPDSGFKRARGVLVLPSDLWCRCFAGRPAICLLWLCPPASNVPVTFLIAVVLPSGLCCRCYYAIRTAASNVPGFFWFCLRACGFLVMQAGQRFPKFPSFVFGSALEFVVSLLCKPGIGFKRARGVLALPIGLWCRCYAIRTAASKVAVLFGSALRFVLFLLCQPDSGLKRACFRPPICGVVVMPEKQRLQTCLGCLLLLWLCPPIGGVVVVPTAGKRFKACPGLWFYLRICDFVVMQAGKRLQTCPGLFVLSSDLWCCCYASRTAASNVPGAVGYILRCCYTSRTAM